MDDPKQSSSATPETSSSNAAPAAVAQVQAMPQNSAAPVSATVAAGPSTVDQSLTPLLLRTFGRTGSTLMMQLLGTSTRVCFERQYPFEHRYLSYVFQLARVASIKYKPNPTWNNMVMFHGESDLVGPLPYEDVKAIDRSKMSDRMFVSLWKEFSIAMRSAANIDESVEGFYAEKAPARLCDPSHRLLRARSIFLLRDPRDELVSIMSFNKKRGFLSFGWQEDDTEQSYAKRMIHSRKRFMIQFLETVQSPRAITVKYEDLVTNGHHEAQRFSDWLDVELDYDKASSNSSVRSEHMTSSDPAASVGRWRKELGQDTQDIFRREMAEQFEALGYPL